jgi:hypothetical protein
MSRREKLDTASSRFVGVYWDVEKNRYRATIEVGGKRYRLGRHAEEREAARAYDLAAVQLGVPDRRNFTEETT